MWSSTLLRPALDATTAGRLTLAGGLAVLDTVREFGVDSALKWPNDVVVTEGDARRKLAGVLVERVVDEVPIAGKSVGAVLDGPGDLQFVVSGAGINADLDPGDLETGRPVTTMRVAVGPIDPTAVAVAFHANLLERSAAVERETGFAALRDDWREHATTLGDRIRISRRAIPSSAAPETSASAASCSSRPTRGPSR